MIALAWVCLGCAAVPALLYLWNSFLFREPPGSTEAAERPRISVLIPARNEERGIADCVNAVLASRGVDLEIVVLDDHSTDRTGAIVREIASRDPRVRVEPAPTLPTGWCGKQHACATLAGLARQDVMAFLDADVRLAPDALARMTAFLKESRAALVSGFPRQETGTLTERIVIPLIHWLLLSFLPLWAMRRYRWPAFGAGCGQWFMTARAAYERAGGHTAVRSSLHDGLTLPRAYRRAGLTTDVCDAKSLAACRMYHSGREVWHGLAKNAREGMAATRQIAFWTIVLLCGQIVPFAMIGLSLWIDSATLPVFVGTAALVLYQRAHLQRRWYRDQTGTLLHPVSALVLLAIQWHAMVWAMLGRPVRWKGRAHRGAAK